MRDIAESSDGSNQPELQPLPMVTKLVFLTVGVYILQIATSHSAGEDSQVFEWLALERDLLFESGQIWRLLTYAFCHSENQILHLICNMVALFFVGRIVAHKLGDREFLALYLVSAVFSGIVQACSMAVFRAPGPAWVLGASGAVCAVFMLFAMYYPRMKLYLFGIIPIQAQWLLLALVAYDTLGFLGLAPSIFAGGGTTVGHAAHLGGLAFGFLYFQGSMNLTGWWDKLAGRRPEPRPRERSVGLRVYNPGFQPDVSYADRVDDVLDKISRQGKESLTPRELRILNQASEHLNGSKP